MFFSIITIKMPFLSNLLIFLYYKSIKGVFCTKTNIFIYKDCLIDIPAKLIGISIVMALVRNCHGTITELL